MSSKHRPPIGSIRLFERGLRCLLVLLPLQTFITVAIAHHTGHLYLLSAWKEVLVLLLAFGAFGLAVKYKVSLSRGETVLILLTAAYLGLHLAYILAGERSIETLIAAAINTRFVLIFWAAWATARLSTTESFRPQRIVIKVALVVAVIAVSLVAIFPKTTLQSFGYDAPGTNTLGVPPAYHTISDTELIRAQATLRGPNALGAYLVLPIALLLFYRTTNRNTKQLRLSCLVLLGLALFLTYSRSAWLAVLLVGATYGLTQGRHLIYQYWRQLLLAFVGLSLMLFSVLQHPSARQLILHDAESGAVGSNQGHWQAFVDGVDDVVRHPFGGGLGSAGPASALDDGQAKVAENYFLQVGQELGWAGLGLLVALHIMILKELTIHRSKKTGMAILAAFVGLTLTNLVLHTWSDEAVAITVWLVMGSFLGAAIIEQNTIRNEKTTQEAR